VRGFLCHVSLGHDSRVRRYFSISGQGWVTVQMTEDVRSHTGSRKWVGRWSVGVLPPPIYSYCMFVRTIYMNGYGSSTRYAIYILGFIGYSK